VAGFIILQRDILEWEWYQDPEVSRLFFHLLLKANFTNKKWRGIEVLRGQLITSNNHLSEKLDLSVQQIRTALKKLEKSGNITRKSTNKFTLLTIVNYDARQNSYCTPNKQNNTPTTIKQQTINKRSTTTKESNKIKNLNKEKIELRLAKFKKQVFGHSQYSTKILNDFFNYWSEFNTAKTKMKFENQRGYFEIAKRLIKWSENEWKTTNKNTHLKNTISNR
jgi:biotin operon repressor